MGLAGHAKEAKPAVETSRPAAAGTQPRRAVVTGGAGFLGRYVCSSLLAAGTDVVCVDNFLTSTREGIRGLLTAPGFQLHQADVSAGLDIDGPVDLVIHLASPASPTDYQRHPLETLAAGSEGTRNALDLAARTRARFVLASTSEVYGDPAVSPQPEDYWGNVNPVGPRSMYDEAKRFAEALTTAYRTTSRADTGIVRIFNSYGAGMRPDDGRAVPVFASRALRGMPLPVTGDGSQTRSLCYVSDTVAGILAFAASDLPGPVNIGRPDEATILEIAERIIRLAGSRSTIAYVPRPPDDPMTRCPDISLARSALGWEPHIPWDVGLSETLAWFSARLSDTGTAADAESAGGFAAPGNPRLPRAS
jgi:dTDP-glucose 4,6-dehydratase